LSGIRAGFAIDGPTLASGPRSADASISDQNSWEADVDTSTDVAMEALTEIALALHAREGSLNQLEWRTYVWARSSLAVLLAIRAEAALADLV
jgi:hypothetical protein